MLCVAPLLQLPFMSHSLVIMLLYIWSRRNPHEQFRIYGIFTVGAGYLSWVLLGAGLVMGMSPVVDLVGIAVGHLYFFLKDVIPGEFPGIDPLSTPSLLYKVFPGDNQEIEHAPVFRDPPNFFDVDQNEEEERRREQQADLREENNEEIPEQERAEHISHSAPEVTVNNQDERVQSLHHRHNNHTTATGEAVEANEQ